MPPLPLTSHSPPTHFSLTSPSLPPHLLLSSHSPPTHFRLSFGCLSVQGLSTKRIAHYYVVGDLCSSDVFVNLRLEAQHFGTLIVDDVTRDIGVADSIEVGL